MLPSPTVGHLPLTAFDGTRYGPFGNNHFHSEGRYAPQAYQPPLLPESRVLVARSIGHGQHEFACPTAPAPKFGKQMLTRAMQAGILSRRLTFRDIFTAVATLLLCVVILPVRQLQGDEYSAYRKAA